MPFQNRYDAGIKLAEKLSHLQAENPIVIGIARGGVIVANEVAKALNAPLDVIVAREISAPSDPDAVIGGVGPNGVRILDKEYIAELGISPEQVEELTRNVILDMDRRLHRYRTDRPMPDINGRTVILVDEGLDTGLGAWAAVRAIRKLQPAKIVLAVPVTSPEAMLALAEEVDELVYVDTPSDFMTVGENYRKYSELKDEDVIEILLQSWRQPLPENPQPVSKPSRRWF